MAIASSQYFQSDYTADEKLSNVLDDAGVSSPDGVARDLQTWHSSLKNTASNQ